MAPKTKWVCSLLQRCTSVLLMGTLFGREKKKRRPLELLSIHQTALSSPPLPLSSQPAVTKPPPASLVSTTARKNSRGFMLAVVKGGQKLCSCSSAHVQFVLFSQPLDTRDLSISSCHKIYYLTQR